MQVYSAALSWCVAWPLLIPQGLLLELMRPLIVDDAAIRELLVEFLVPHGHIADSALTWKAHARAAQGGDETARTNSAGSGDARSTGGGFYWNEVKIPSSS
jgi:hypothetical protein